MTDISVNNLIKSFEIGNNILDGLSFTVEEGEHVGILGRNGCGKTTLFKILTGALDYDSGDVVRGSGKQIGLISQIPVYPAGWTTEDVLRDAQSEIYRLSARLDELQKQLETDDSPRLIKEYDSVSERFLTLGGYDADRSRNRVANGLGIPADMRERLFDSLSGGEKTRINLARLLLTETEILLLDEPTNHLDMHAIKWLEDYIASYKGTVLAISHDRYFLDKVCERCIEIESGKAEFYSGNYSFYVAEKQRRFEERMKQYEKDAAKAEQLKKAAEQMRLWAFMGNDKLYKRAFSMEKRIEKLSKTEKPGVQKKLTVKFKQADFSGDEVLAISGVSKSFGGRRLFDDFSAIVEGKEAIALIGDNGTGKTTLLKLITGDEAPDTGYVLQGPTVRRAYLEQIVKFSDPSRSMYDTMLYDAGCEPQEARDRLAAFGFTGDVVHTPVAVLSGGELSRLRLCILMGREINFLILDEPTNHLDIASREWMENALQSYEETLLFVSHDRYFIEKFATRIWLIENGEITDFKGTYSAFEEWRARQAVFSKAVRQPEPKKEKQERAPRNSKNALQKTEKEIEKLESRLDEIRALSEEYASDYVKLMELDEEKSALDEALVLLYKKWEELSS